MISITGINIGVADRKCAGQAKPGVTREGNEGWTSAGAEWRANREEASYGMEWVQEAMMMRRSDNNGPDGGGRTLVQAHCV